MCLLYLPRREIPLYNTCYVYIYIPIYIYIYEEEEKKEAEVPEAPVVPPVSETGGGLPGVPDKITVADKEIDLKGAFFPPPHVKSCGVVYSNAYRKSMAANGQNTEVAKADAKRATFIFQQYKVVTPALCGKFRAAPRKRSKDAPTPEEPVEPTGGEDGEMEEGAEPGEATS